MLSMTSPLGNHARKRNGTYQNKKPMNGRLERPKKQMAAACPTPAWLFSTVGLRTRLRKDRSVANSPDVLNEAIEASAGAYRWSDGRMDRRRGVTGSHAILTQLPSMHIVMAGGDPLGQFTLAGSERLGNRIQAMLRATESVIKGTDLSERFVATSLVVTVDCACSRARMGLLFRQSVS